MKALEKMSISWDTLITALVTISVPFLWGYIKLTNENTALKTEVQNLKSESERRWTAVDSSIHAMERASEKKWEAINSMSTNMAVMANRLDQMGKTLDKVLIKLEA